MKSNEIKGNHKKSSETYMRPTPRPTPGSHPDGIDPDSFSFNTGPTPSYAFGALQEL